MQNAEEAAELKKKRAFRKFSYRGIDLDQYVPFHPHDRCNRHIFALPRFLPCALGRPIDDLNHKAP